MRPLFPESLRHETQIIAMVLSADSANDPDVIAMTAASAAAYCSDLPFTDPIAAVRVGLLDGNLVANPTVAEQKTSKLNIVVAGTEKGIVMVESGAFEVSEEKVAEAIEAMAEKQCADLERMLPFGLDHIAVILKGCDAALFRIGRSVAQRGES